MTSNMRVVAFGCSNTYGHGLKDCHIADPSGGPGRPGPKPSMYAWPQIWGETMNHQVVNLGEPGGSNRLIWHKILNFDFKPNDYVAILWTYPDRYAAFFDDGTVQNLGSWPTVVPAGKAWQRYIAVTNSNKDRYLENLLLMDHANRFLKQKHPLIKQVINMKFNSELYPDENPSWCNFNWDIAVIDDIREKYDKAPDGLHMGPHAHMAIVERLRKVMI